MLYHEKERPNWFEFECLPAYAPELYAVEECWNHTKYADSANFIPQDLNRLEAAVCESMLEQREDQTLLPRIRKTTSVNTIIGDARVNSPDDALMRPRISSKQRT